MAKKGYQVYGVDYSPTAIEIAEKLLAEKNVSGKVILADVRKLPFPDNFFDIVTSLVVIEHLDSNQATIESLNEAYRVLKLGGRLYAHTGPNKLNLDFPVRFYQRYANYLIFSLANLFKKGKKYKTTLEIRSEKDRTLHVNEQTYFSLKNNLKQSRFRKYRISILADPLEINPLTLPYYILVRFFPLNKIFPFSIILGNYFYIEAIKT
jgi:ubiquinone/menaquinone biosynthesis C-methylase UbiE